MQIDIESFVSTSTGNQEGQERPEQEMPEQERLEQEKQQERQIQERQTQWGLQIQLHTTSS